MKYFFIILLVFITGCTTVTPIKVYSRECLFMKSPFMPHEKDVFTPGTWRQLETIIDGYFRNCGSPEELAEYESMLADD